jgi:hypothetical protein
MCMVHEADPAKFYNVRSRKAGQQRRCSECRKTIRRGERYEHASLLMEGYGWETFSTCQKCQAARQWLKRECGGWCYGGVLEDLIDHWNEGCHGDDLGELISGMKRKWQ